MFLLPKLKEWAKYPIDVYHQWHRMDDALRASQEGRCTESCEFFMEALRHRPLHHPIRQARITAALGHCFMESERYEEMLHYFREQYRKEPANTIVQYYLGVASWYSGLFVEAFEMFDKIADFAGETYDVLTCRGQLHAELGRAAEARADLKKAIGLAQSSTIEKGRTTEAYCRNGLAAAAIVDGRLEEALSEVALSLQLEPDNGWAHLTIGRVHELKGNRSDALLAYKRSATARTPPLTKLQMATISDKIRLLENEGL